jgi:uncharacterized protein YegP (UPF0339 family)
MQELELTFEYYLDKASEWRWTLKTHGKTIGDSGEGYKNKSDCLAMIEKIKQHAKDAKVVEVKK